MKKNKEPKVWRTLLMLLLGVVVIVGSVGLALWYADKLDTSAKLPKPDTSWGIFSDSPLRKSY